MATTEEKTELVETLKGPRFYRIQLWGYGGEAEYMHLTKEQYEFWHAHIEEHGDSDAVNYCVNAEDGEYDFEELEDNQKVMVNHVASLNNKIAQARFDLDQLQVAQDAFSKMLVASVNETPEAQPEGE